MRKALTRIIRFAASRCIRCGAVITNEHADHCPECGEIRY